MIDAEEGSLSTLSSALKSMKSVAFQTYLYYYELVAPSVVQVRIKFSCDEKIENITSNFNVNKSTHCIIKAVTQC